MKILQKNTAPIQEFVEEIINFPELKIIILNSKENNGAKLTLITDSTISQKINEVVEKIKSKYNFSIEFVELSSSQFESLKNFKDYELDKKIVWKRD